ncbi:MAG: glycosyltransferase [Candidatus Magnetoovum sp. WYHC-5]|nr:glycosyltransferase [Candidatus Magnetoovum sp. WYHC-5]
MIVFIRGLFRVLRFLYRKISYFFYYGSEPYTKWTELNEPDDNVLIQQREIVQLMVEKPFFSILLNLNNLMDRQQVTELIKSIIKQTYDEWELCVFCTGYEDVLGGIERLKVLTNVRHGDVYKELFLVANGRYIIVFDENMVLAPFALYELAIVVKKDSVVDFLYSDSDFLDSCGKRLNPHFKPCWSVDMLRSYNYISNFVVMERGVFEKSISFLGSKINYGFILYATENARKIIRIPKILYHLKTADMCSYDDGVIYLKEHLRRVALDGEVSHVSAGKYRISYKLNVLPLISIIIPNRDNGQMLKRCVESILQGSTYKNIEFLIIENGSRLDDTFRLYDKLRKISVVRLLEYKGKFNFSDINNYAVGYANGDVILFLNNDTQLIESGSLGEMLTYAVREDVGAVGCKLYYPDGTVQHGGIAVGICSVAGHLYKGMREGDKGALGLKVVCNVSAVTGACLMVRRKVFLSVGGFDSRLALSYNDVDICLKFIGNELINVWTPYGQFIHYESKSRGYDLWGAKRQRLIKESQYFKSKWKVFFEEGDPFYNPNLTKDREDLSLNL